MTRELGQAASSLEGEHPELDLDHLEFPEIEPVESAYPVDRPGSIRRPGPTSDRLRRYHANRREFDAWFERMVGGGR